MKFTKMLALITDILNKDADTQVDVCLTAQMANQIELWTRMYENRSPWVNNKDVLSANLAPAIASELARLVTLEMKSDITGGPAANYSVCFHGAIQKRQEDIYQIGGSHLTG